MAIDPFSSAKTCIDLIGRFVGYHIIRREQKDSRNLASRFLAVHEAHGLLPIQIPQALGIQDLLQPRDVLQKSRLIEAMNHEMLRRTSELYGITQAWIEGEDVHPYPILNFYKDPIALIEFVKNLRDREKSLRLFCVKAKESPIEEVNNDELFAVFVAQNFYLGDKEVDKFFPVQGGWLWSHQPARIDFKTLISVCHHLGIRSFGRNAPRSLIKKVVEGKKFPSAVIGDGAHWYPDDFIYIAGKNSSLIDHQEALTVHNYMSDVGAFKVLEGIRR